MLKRQKILLQLLANSSRDISRTRLTKLAFLLSQLGKSDYLRTFYEFLPYLYGPYSFTLNHELDNLLRTNMIAFNDQDRIHLTVAGREQIKNMDEPQFSIDLKLLKSEYDALGQSLFMETVYKQFPWFTVNSQKPLMQKTKTTTSCANYTIGYQTHQVDGLLNCLLEQGIEQLIDTRLNPVSRVYGFHKSTLSSLCKKIGIAYVHVPQVGVPSSWRQELETEEAFRNLFKRYEIEILDRQKSILMELAKKMTLKPSTLMCMELEHDHCHRSRLAARLSKINGLPICELNDLYARTI